MKNTIKKICAGVIVCALAFSCTACATTAERQKEEEIIRRAEEEVQKAEEEKEERQEMYKDLWDSIPDSTRPTLSCPTTPIEPQYQVTPEVDAQFYERIIANSPAEAINERHLRVGESITPAAAVSLIGFNRYVYSSDTNVVTVSEDCKITAVAPGEANVVIGDGSVYLVYLCIVTEE